MVPLHLRTHVADGLKRLLWQYKEKPVIEGFLTAWLQGAQDAEDLIWQVIEGRMLNAAVGNQLDILGRIVGELRQGKNDADYKAAIALRIRVNRSQGLAVDIIDVTRLATGGTAFTYTEIYPAKWEVDVAAYPFPNLLAAFLHETKASGTGGRVVYSIADFAHTSHFDNAAAPLGSAYLFDTVGGAAHLFASVVLA